MELGCTSLVLLFTSLPGPMESNSALQQVTPQEWCAHGYCVCWCCPESVGNGRKEWSWNPRVIQCLIQVCKRLPASLTKAVPRGIHHQSHQGTADNAERAGWSREPRQAKDCPWGIADNILELFSSPWKVSFCLKVLGHKSCCREWTFAMNSHVCNGR